MRLLTLALFCLGLAAAAQDSPEEKARGYLGVNMGAVRAADRREQGLRRSDGGVKVTGIVSKSSAEIAGLEEGDIILKFDGKEVDTVSSLRRLIVNGTPGTQVELLVVRDRGRKKIKVVLGMHPDDAKRIKEERNPLVKLSKLCGSAIPWTTDGGADARTDRAKILKEALKEAGKRKRLVLWYAYRVPGQHIQNFKLLDRYMRSGPWSDPDVIELVKRKFVPVRMMAARDVGRRRGIEALDVMEPALVFLDPGGKVVHLMERLRSLNPDFIVTSLRLVLRENDRYNAPTKSDAEGLDKIEARILDGDYAGAAKALEGAVAKGDEATLGRVYYQLGILERRRFKAESALKALDKAVKHLAEPGDAWVERALVLLKSGKLAEAKEAYEAVIKDHPDCSRLPEARYRLGVCHYLLNDEPEAEKVWSALADETPGSTWAWKAAAGAAKRDDVFFGDSGLTHSSEDPLWPAPGALAELRSGSEWPQKKEDAPGIARRAVEWLLRHQRSNGSWPDSRYVFGQGPIILPNVWMAVTALCSAALLDWRELDPERIDRALERSTKFILDEANINRGKYETDYADCYRLAYLAKRATAFPDEKEKMIEAMNDIVEKLVKLQKRSGFWWHEYENAFTTGAVLHCLALAEKAGADVPGTNVARGVRALKKCRAPDGSYPYATRGRSSLKNASGRMTVCELGLYLHEEGSLANIERGLKTFFEYHPKLDRVRKSDYHADQELAGFFYFHTVWPATEAVLLFKEKQRKKYGGRLLEILVKIPEIDGSFACDHEVGKSYSTGMALLSLKNLLRAVK
jgi:tetratricopeptide (TPR) repeat protein